MQTKRKGALLAALAALAIGAAGCGSAEDDGETVASASASEEPAAGDAAVTIRTFMYEPDPLEVEAGTTVTFTNEDDILHTVTEGTKAEPVKGGFDEQLDGAGSAAEISFDEPGAIDYTCTIHDGMDGRVVVN